MWILLRLVLLTAAFAVGTWTFGWWAVPVIAAIWGFLARGAPGSGLAAAVAAMLAWGVLLGVDAAGGRLGALIGRVAPLFTLPAFALMLITVALAALLAWLAASVAGALVARTNQ